MNAHVLLNLLNELSKRDKIRILQIIFSLIGTECDKTETWMLYSIYHMTFGLF